jgi:octaprenyl-diphosphate synthase
MIWLSVMSLVSTLRAVVRGQARGRDAGTTEIGGYTERAVATVHSFLDELERDPQASLVPRLTEARRHLLRDPGKMVRPLIVSLLGRALELDDAAMRPYALSVELVHAASLLHDDVVDRADTRRRRPTANAAYDNTIPVLAGDGILAEVMERVAAQGDLSIIQAIASTIQDLVSGEAWQYELRGGPHDDVQACLDVAELKTGALLSLCTWIPARVARLPDEQLVSFAAIGRYTGVSFQIIDDALDFDAHNTGKPMLADWSEAKTNVMTAQLLLLEPSARPALTELFAQPQRPSPEDCARVLATAFAPATLAEARKRTNALAEEYATLADHHARFVPQNLTGRLFEALRKSLLRRTS